MSFNNHRFSGTVTVPANLQAIFMRNNAISDVVFPSLLHRLELVDMRNNELRGALDDALTRADALVALHLDGNMLTELPRRWDRAADATVRLHVLDVSHNNLQVRPSPPALLPAPR